ncbi:MAG: translation initiation factor IF-2 subunit beta [Candidatus Korarchaeota archaeon]|nr:translation initiation factor IF-2 subunit beta [Candidatus Korarchaeota archaeon]
MAGQTFDYDALLERLYARIPRKQARHERFEVPPVKTEHIGSRTLVRNFKEISDVLRREPRLLMRYLLKELAAAGSYDEDSGMLMINIKVSSSSLNRLIQLFVKQYVICPTCGRPDTRRERRGKAWILVSEACGAETPVKPF